MAAEEQRFLTAYKKLGSLQAEVFKVVYLGNEELTPDKQLGSIKFGITDIIITYTM